MHVSETVTSRKQRLAERADCQSIRPALTPAQFQHKYNISHAKFYEEVAKGRLHLFKMGRSSRILPDEEDRYVAAGQRAA